MSIFSLGDFEVWIDGKTLGPVKPLSVESFIEATVGFDLPTEPIEFTFELSPDCTGSMPPCVKRTRRSRRRWRGKGRNWNSLFGHLFRMRT